ncbi:MAG: bifunctional demethylmenaquinone methyltransferase/2-methoxy-6-polyprenyl-1,4-benzoquinol methylase UbiE [Thermosynechococcaceae cyanobacterium MS004]|nr:bifunctional demethylmenaquinone methyltransferase/2-methoxy-6-polyprenyl-1,4-benzoquinol methylase UbiE [Thermosynechococcaceae cyanobacterium MS004]
MHTTSSPQVQALFDQIAPMYDQLNAWLSLGQHRVWKQMTVRWANPKRGGVNVDLCCGSGDLTLLMARTLRGQAQTLGIDFSHQQLAIAQQRSSLLPWADAIQWIESDVLTLPLADSSVDAVTMGYGLRNVANIPQALQEIYRILKPQSRAAILDFNRSESPELRRFQQWYLQQIVVPVASWFQLKEEYAYLETSIARFPTGAEQVELAIAAGFESVCYYPIALGMMGVLVMTKPH